MSNMKTEPEMDWSQLFASRTALMTPSALRELLKVTSRAEVISFAGGLPAAELFPVPRFKSALAAVLDQHGGKSLQYSITEGLPELRDWIALRFSTPRLRIAHENVLITSGAQQALSLLGRILFEKGDRVIVENPTYLALLSAWRPTGVEFMPALCDARGLRVEKCRPLMKRKPKAIYCVPNFQNPLGATMSLPRRKKLAALARAHSMAIIEDNPYGELRYSGRALPNLLELDAPERPGSDFSSRVIYAGTFSKVLAPGLRVGWVIASKPVIEKLALAKQAADLQTSTLNQYLALELVRQGFLEDFIPVLRRHYGQRRDAMLEALDRYFPKSARWTKPDGGVFLWVTLPPGADSGHLLEAALNEGVAFVPGGEFHLNGEGKNTMRLNFSNMPPARIEEGIKKLGGLLRRGVNSIS